MAKEIELRRHTDSDGDVLTRDEVKAALALGATLRGGYHVLVSSGAQRATQTLACLACALGERISSGAYVESGLRSEVEDRWRRAYQRAGSGELGALRSANPELVERFGDPRRSAQAGARRAARRRARWSSGTAQPTRPRSGIDRRDRVAAVQGRRGAPRARRRGDARGAAVLTSVPEGVIAGTSRRAPRRRGRGRSRPHRRPGRRRRGRGPRAWRRAPPSGTRNGEARGQAEGTDPASRSDGSRYVPAAAGADPRRAHVPPARSPTRANA
jgi:hypothetical protein